MTVMDLPPQAQKRVEDLRRFLEGLGFDKNTIEPNWEALSTEQPALEVDLVAYSDANHRNQDTACLIVKAPDATGQPPGYLDPLVEVGAPFALVATEPKAQLWRMPQTSADQSKRLREFDFDYDDLPTIVSDWRRRLGPQAIARAKLGLPHTLWDKIPEYFQYAAEVSENNLLRLFEDVRASLGQVDYSQRLTGLLLALGGMILEDKSLLGGARASDWPALLQKLKSSYPRVVERYCPQLSGSLDHDPSDVLTEFHRAVRPRLKFAGLTFQMLMTLYEKAMLGKVAEEERREKGISVTPLALARRMLEVIPLEDLRPEGRMVLDPCCGSGALLLSAQERLLKIPDIRRVEKGELTDYVRDCVRGFDKEGSSALIATLGLLSFGLPGQEDVSVNIADTVSAKFAPDAAPAAILAHPPQSAPDADAFVSRCVEWVRPGGYLGLILPFGFMTTRAMASRGSLFGEKCELLEAWDLPPDPKLRLHQSLALVVRKHEAVASVSSIACARVVHVVGGHEDVERFLIKREPTVSSVTSRQPRAGTRDDPSVPSALDRLWYQLSCLDQRLMDVAEIGNGPKPYSADELRKRGVREEEVFPEAKAARRRHVYPFLLPTSISLYCLAWGEQKDKRLVDLSKPLDRPRPEWFPRIVEEKLPKVIVKASSCPHNPWRLTVALDDRGLVPRNSLHFVLAKDEHGLPAQAIAALLSCRVVNAWMYCHNKTRQVHAKSLKSIPIPALDSRTVRELTRLHDVIAQTAQAPLPDTASLQASFAALDRLCDDVYGVRDREKKLLDDLFASAHRAGPRGEQLRPRGATSLRSVRRPTDLWITYGEVTSVDADRARMTLWLADGEPGKRELECAIPQEFPGWALETGATFEAEIDRGWLKRRTGSPKFFTIRPIGYAYASVEEMKRDLRRGT